MLTVATPTLDITAAQDTGEDNADNITTIGWDSTILNLTGNAEAGSEVTLYKDGIPLLLPIIADVSTGDFSFDVSTSGSYFELTAKAKVGIETSNASTPVIVDAAAPKIDNIVLKNTANISTYNFETSGADQLKPVPLGGGANEIEIHFSEDVNIVKEDFSFVNVNGKYEFGNPAIYEFSYDDTNFIATWTLDQYITIGQMQINLTAAAITDTAGNLLDGDWTNPDNLSDTNGNNSSFPAGSGDGNPGGNFNFDLNFLPGDFNRDGVVDETDKAIVVGNNGVPGGWVNGDADGDGTVEGDPTEDDYELWNKTQAYDYNFSDRETLVFAKPIELTQIDGEAKVVISSQEDLDQDGIPDWLDGFNLDGVANNDDDNISIPVSGETEYQYFAELEFTVPDLGLSSPEEKIILEIDYNDNSDPSNLSVNDEWVFENPPAGLRLWTEPATTQRDRANYNLGTQSGGDFISGIDSEEHILTYDKQGQTFTFYVEGIDVGSGVADGDLGREEIYFTIYKRIIVDNSGAVIDSGLHPDQNVIEGTGTNGIPNGKWEVKRWYGKKTVKVMPVSLVRISATDKYAAEAPTYTPEELTNNELFREDLAGFTLSVGDYYRRTDAEGCDDAGIEFTCNDILPEKVQFRLVPSNLLNLDLENPNDKLSAAASNEFELYIEKVGVNNQLVLEKITAQSGVYTVDMSASPQFSSTYGPSNYDYPNYAGHSVNVFVKPVNEDSAVEWDEVVQVQMVNVIKENANSWKPGILGQGQGDSRATPLYAVELYNPGSGVLKSPKYNFNMKGSYLSPMPADVIILDDDEIDFQINRNVDLISTGLTKGTISNGVVEVDVQQGSVTFIAPLQSGINAPSYRSDDNLYPIFAVELMLPDTPGGDPTAMSVSGNFGGIPFGPQTIDSANRSCPFSCGG